MPLMRWFTESGLWLIVNELAEHPKLSRCCFCLITQLVNNLILDEEAAAALFVMKIHAWIETITGYCYHYSALLHG